MPISQKKVLDKKALVRMKQHCKMYIEAVETDTVNLFDFNQILLEDAMEVVYGEYVWDYINSYS